MLATEKIKQAENLSEFLLSIKNYSIITILSLKTFSTQEKMKLLHSLTADKNIIEVMHNFVQKSWTVDKKFVSAVEDYILDLFLDFGNENNLLNIAQKELFDIRTIVLPFGELREMLSSKAVSYENKKTIVEKLFANKISDFSMQLILFAVQTLTMDKFIATLWMIQKKLANKQKLIIANVFVSKELEETQIKKLKSAIEKKYDHPLDLNVVVDEEIIGGIRVEIEGKEIDNTMLTKFKTLEKQFRA